ncbi:hypothetical protein L3Q82_016403, partial [Scortum barcoo]
HDVTLRCETKTPTNLPAEFFKTDSSLGKKPTHQMIIHDFSQSDEGAYKCSHSWTLEELQQEALNSLSESLCSSSDDLDPASLTVLPNSSQLFEYENITLSCGVNGWRTVRATSSDNKVSPCGSKWGNPTTSGCTLNACKQPDSGVYWCESPSKQRSNSVSITVHGGSVILQSPVLPVMEGDDVTLHCKTKTPPSNLPAAFYKDGSLIRPESAGHMTIRHVSKSDEGLYKCHISSHGESPPSWLFVRSEEASCFIFCSVLNLRRFSREYNNIYLSGVLVVPGRDDVAPPSQILLILLCHLLACVPYFISTGIMLSLYCHKPT